MSTDYDNPWTYQGEPFLPADADLEKWVGFCYKLTDDTGKSYIGKKFFWKPKTLPVTKTRKRKVKTKVPSDWKKYYGSSVTVKDLVEQGNNFTREILHLARTKGECTYFEAREQFAHDVLLRDDYYNEFIGTRINASHLKLLKEDYNRDK